MLITKEHLPEIQATVQRIKALLEVEDDASFDAFIMPKKYDITSFGANLEINGLVKRLNNGEIFIPSLPRNYVWKLDEASRFIESLLLGLPVPGIFLARDFGSDKLLVIDGQQRLKTLQFFYAGYFNSPEEEPQEFSLWRVQRQFEGKTYQTLEAIKRHNLDNATIHATIVKQDSSQYDDTSLYHIFERLNSGSKHLTPQEIRANLYHGQLMDFIKKLNQLPNWRNLFGKPSVSLKDEELILRFLALYFANDDYQQPMKEFLNLFAYQNRQPSNEFFLEAERVFTSTINIIWHNFGEQAFKLKESLNTAMFDSIMVGLARAMKRKMPDNTQIKKAYEELLNDKEYINAISDSTSSKNSVEMRLQTAIEKFSAIYSGHHQRWG